MNNSIMKLLAERCYKCTKLRGVRDNKSTWKRLPVGLFKSKYTIFRKKVSWKLLETLFSRDRKEVNVRMFA